MDAGKLIIRGAEPDDYGALQVLHAQPKVIHGTMQIPFTSQEVWRKRCIERPENFRMLVACVDKEMVGCAAIVTPVAIRRRHAGELGLCVHDAWHCRGIGSALLSAIIDLADRWLNVHRIELTVYTDNVAAIALYRKFGFVHEGRFVRWAFRNGEYADVFAMARVK